jgi:hypothetical protein
MAADDDRMIDGQGLEPRSFTAGLGRVWDVSFQIMVATMLMVSYFMVRGHVVDQSAEALANSLSIVKIERALGLFWEPTWQASIIGYEWVIWFLNQVYIWGYWPVLVSVGLWTLFRHRDTWFAYRNAIFVSAFIGMLVFVAFPVAPPRLAPVNMVDTVEAYAQAGELAHPTSLANQYAAVPSFHFGWILLTSLIALRIVRRRLVRAFWIGLPALMPVTIVVTANHYVLDAVAGGAVSLFALWASRPWTAWNIRRQAETIARRS